jgi:transglutaminase-like putative cysteine protease
VLGLSLLLMMLCLMACAAAAIGRRPAKGDAIVTITDGMPVAEAFERGQVARDVQLDADGRSVILYDVTLVEDDGPGACAAFGHGPAAPTTIRDGVQVKKVLHVDRPEANAARLVLCVGPVARNSAPLRVAVNGRDFTLRAGRRLWSGHDWPVIRVPATLLRRGDNEVVLSSGGEAGWWVAVAQREHILQNDPERRSRPRRSFRSTDGGRTWAPALGDDGRQEGELMIRLHLTQYAAQGELVGPVIDLASQASDGSELPAAVAVDSVRLRAARKLRRGTAVVLAVRSGDSPVYDPARWGEWQQCSARGAVRGGLRRFVQWRAVLTTTAPKATPVLEAVTLEAQVQGRPVPWAQQVRLVESHNEEIRYTSLPFEYERFDEPQLVALRKQYALDDVVAGARSELEKMIRLRNWVSAQWKWDPPVGHYPAWDAHEILEMRRGFCVQYAIVFMQCALSLGMQTRFVFGHFPDVRLKGEGVCGHEVNEYWSNEFGKWVMMDAHQDECFANARTGVPAGILELHEDQLNSYAPDGIDVEGAAFDDERESEGLLLWKGVEPEPRPERPRMAIKWGYLYWMPRNNYYAHRFPEPLRHGFNWTWTGYRLWQDERTPRQWRLGHSTRRRSDIEWTLNQVRWAAAPAEEPGVLRLNLGTVTPDFDTFLIRTDGGAWRPSAPTLDWALHPGRNRIEMRVRTRAGVLGRVSWAEVEYRG